MKGKLTMNNKVFVCLLIIAVLLPGSVFGMASFDFPVKAPVVSFVQGDVTVKGAGAADWVAVEVGRLLASGDTVRTGPASRAEISCATGKMRLFENTVIVVPQIADEEDKKDIRRIEMGEGTGLFRIKKRGVDKSFEVQTENIIAGVKGTLFGVKFERFGMKSTVFVYHGVVLVTDLKRTPETATELRRGQALEVVGSDGFNDRMYFNPEDLWYQWRKLNSFDLKFLDKRVLKTFGKESSGDGSDGNQHPDGN